MCVVTYICRFLSHVVRMMRALLLLKRLNEVGATLTLDDTGEAIDRVIYI